MRKNIPEHIKNLDTVLRFVNTQKHTPEGKLFFGNIVHFNPNLKETDIKKIVKEIVDSGYVNEVIDKSFYDGTVYQYSISKKGEIFIGNGGYEKEFKKEKYDYLAKGFLYKSRLLPYIISALTLGFTIWVYFKKPEKTKQEQEQEKYLIESTTRNKVLFLLDSLDKIKHILEIQNQKTKDSPTVGQAKP